MADWTPGMIALLGGTATLGIVLQTLLLVFFWRRAGLHLRPDFRWRGLGLGKLRDLAEWTFLMVLAGQLAGLVQSRVLSPASGEGAAMMASQNAWLIFMLPYSIIVLSIGTPYFTQLSEHAHAGRDDEVRADIGSSIRTLGLFTVIATAALHGRVDPGIPDLHGQPRPRRSMRRWCSCASSCRSCRWPCCSSCSARSTPTTTRARRSSSRCCRPRSSSPRRSSRRRRSPSTGSPAGVALGQSISSIIQVIVATWLLNRRLGGIGVGRWMLSLGRFVLAAVPAAAAGWGTFLLLGGVDGWTVSDRLLGRASAPRSSAASRSSSISAMLALLRAPELAVVGPIVRKLRGR